MFNNNQLETLTTNKIVTSSSWHSLLKVKKIFMLWLWFGLVVRVAHWHAGDPGSIPGRDGRYTFGCIFQRFESASAEILRYIKTVI
jgi:hypothetical protein